MKRQIFEWGPAVLWAAVILAASSEPLSAEHTGQWIQDIVVALTGTPLSATTHAVVHFIFRKLAHLTAYGIFGVLAYRGWRRRVAAVVTAAVLASIDEWHQTFVPGRTGAVGDVLIDICGAALAQLFVRRR